MDTLTKKTFHSYDYRSRYTPVPYYYDTLTGREIYGIGANMIKDADWVAHKVKPEDTWDSLALKYYANPSLYWAICYFNNVQDPFKPVYGNYDIIKIPAISQVEFGDDR